MGKILVIGGRPEKARADHVSLLEKASDDLGAAIHRNGHTAVICSVQDGSTDVGVLNGVARAAAGHVVEVVAHLPAGSEPQRAYELGKQLGVRMTVKPHETPKIDGGKESLQYAFLICQLYAVDRCDAIVALGGKSHATASMFLDLAESRDTPIIPLRFVPGAAEDYYLKRRTRYENALRADVSILQDPERIDTALALADRLRWIIADADQSRFFISYSTVQRDHANAAELVLRRAGVNDVFRDRIDIAAGDAFQHKIEEELDRAAVVIVLWSREFACSPYCFVEMEQTLRRRGREAASGRHGLPELWIFAVDDTEVTFPDARKVHRLPGRSPEQLEDELTREVMWWKARRAASSTRSAASWVSQRVAWTAAP